MIVPPPPLPPSPLAWLSWGQFFVTLLFFLVGVILLIKFIFRTEPGEQPGMIAKILVIIAIILVLAVIMFFLIF